MNEDCLKKIELYLHKQKAPFGAFLYGKTLQQFIDNKIKNPKIFINKKENFNNKNNLIIFNSKIKKKESSSLANFYYFKGAKKITEFSIHQYFGEVNLITPIIKKTASAILKGEEKYIFFEEKLPLLKEIFDENSEKSLILKNIEHLLLFRDKEKQIIWFLCCEVQFFRFDTLLNLFFKNKDLFKDFSYLKFNNFYKKIKSHSLGEELFNSRTNLKDQILWWNNIFKKYPFAIGAMESRNKNARNIDQNKIIKYLDDIHKKESEPLVEALDIKFSGVRELLSQNDLKIEAKKMNHCVAGYSGKIKDREARIFSIFAEGESATIEFIKINNEIQINQIKGHSNSKVSSKKIHEIANELKNEIQIKFNKKLTPKKNIRGCMEGIIWDFEFFSYSDSDIRSYSYYRIRLPHLIKRRNLLS